MFLNFCCWIRIQEAKRMQISVDPDPKHSVQGCHRVSSAINSKGSRCVSGVIESCPMLPAWFVGGAFVLLYQNIGPARLPKWHCVLTNFPEPFYMAGEGAMSTRSVFILLVRKRSKANLLRCSKLMLKIARGRCQYNFREGTVPM